MYIDEQHDGDALKCGHALLYIKHGLIIFRAVNHLIKLNIFAYPEVGTLLFACDVDVDL